jgi:hypothetical protein
MAAHGNGTTIEPAVDYTTGNQVFLLTGTNSPFFHGAPGEQPPPVFRNVSAPLYLVTYPMQSTVDVGPNADPLNCYTEGAFVHGLPYNCDHAQIPGIKGHDHLVGVPGSKKAGGDFNVQWHVLVTFFTPQGIKDGAMNTRILTLDQLTDAQEAGDVSGFNDSGIYFDCNVVSAAMYSASTPRCRVLGIHPTELRQLDRTVPEGGCGLARRGHTPTSLCSSSSAAGA